MPRYQVIFAHELSLNKVNGLSRGAGECNRELGGLSHRLVETDAMISAPLFWTWWEIFLSVPPRGASCPQCHLHQGVGTPCLARFSLLHRDYRQPVAATNESRIELP